MNKIISCIVGATLMVAAPTFAQAQSPAAYSFSLSGAGGSFSVTGNIDASSNSTDQQISSITGGNPAQGLTITGLIGNGGFDGNDNRLFPAGSPNDGLFVDANGFAFTASQVNPSNQGNTSYEVRAYSMGGAYFLDLSDSDGYRNDAIPATFNATQTNAVSAAPEPGVWALMLAGIAMIGLTLRQGRRQRGMAIAA